MSEQALRSLEAGVSSRGAAALSDDDALALVQEVRALRAEIAQVERTLDDVLGERMDGGGNDVDTLPG